MKKTFIRFCKDNFNVVTTFTSISAIVISIITVWISCTQFNSMSESNAKQFKETSLSTAEQIELLKTHNKNAVRPILNGLADVSPFSNKYSLTLTNNGTGPAICYYFKIFFNQTQYSKWREIIQGNVFKKWDKKIGIEYAEIDSGTTFSANTSYPLLKVDTNMVNSDPSFLATLSKISLVIKYKSIYQDTFSITLTLADWKSYVQSSRR